MQVSAKVDPLETLGSSEAGGAGGHSSEMGPPGTRDGATGNTGVQSHHQGLPSKGASHTPQLRF